MKLSLTFNFLAIVVAIEKWKEITSKNVKQASKEMFSDAFSYEMSSWSKLLFVRGGHFLKYDIMAASQQQHTLKIH